MKRGSKYLLIIGGAFILLILILALALRGDETRKQEYKIAIVKRGKIEAIVTSTGTVNPLNTVKVGSQVSGNIMEIFVDFNSEVKKNQIISRIDPAVYEAQVEQAKAQLLKARAQLLEAQEDIEVAKANIFSAEANSDSSMATFNQVESQYNRLSHLIGKEIVSRSEFESVLALRANARGDLKVAEARLETAKAQLARTIAKRKGVQALIVERRAALKLAKIKLKYCTIKSPIDGVVISRDVDVGQTVAATLQSPVLFTIAEDLTSMQIEVDVSEADVGQIQPDQYVEFTVDAFPDKKFMAAVRQIRNSPTNIQNVVTYKVVADVKNKDLLLRPGMTANVNIVVAQESGVLKLPNAALRFRPLGGMEEAKPRRPPTTKEWPLYKKTVEKLGLDAGQAKTFEKIMGAAGTKLKTTLKTAEDDTERKGARRAFFTQVFTKLRGILREDQLKKLYAYTRQLKAARSKRKKLKGRPGQVYILDEKGRPKALKILIGITNESETQIIGGDLKEGDGVIAGLNSFSGKIGGKSSGLAALIRILGRR